MKSPAWPLQKAVYQRLSAALSCPVYDQVPEGADSPYITLGDDTAVDWSTKIEAGQEFTVTLHAWSRYPGMKEAKELMGEIIEAMTASALELDGFTPVLLRFEYSDCRRDPDGITRHGVVRFRIKIEED